MNPPLHRLLGPVAGLFPMLPLAGLADSTIAPGDSFAHAANAGWVDFHPSASDGVEIEDSFLRGWAYAANFGWIHFGGTPANGHSYANDSAGDFGVNLDGNGRLSGYAYAGNIGWIRFEPTHGQPRIDFLSGQLDGSIYSGNIGWITLDTLSSDLVAASIARADSDSDGIADAWEYRHFGSLVVADATSNSDKDPLGDVAEYVTGTDPNDATSYFRLTSRVFDFDTHLVELSFTSSEDRVYRIEHSGDLVPPWADSGLGIFAPDPGVETTRSVALPDDPRHFVRAVSILPLQP